MKTPEEYRHSRGPKPWPYRRDAIIACSRVATQQKVNWRQAYAELKKINGGDCYKALGEHWEEFLVRTWEHWVTTGDLQDEPRSGRPQLVSESLALEAARLVKQGKWLDVTRCGRTVSKKVHYTSIHQAVQECDRLRQIQQECGVDDRGLLEAMKRSDPDLVRRTVSFKYEFSKEQRQARVVTTSQLLQMLPESLAERRVFLDRLLWVDEGGVLLSAYDKKSVKVWASAHDFSKHDIVHLPHVPGQKDVKAHFIIGVTSHPKFADKNGLVYWDFTTGTTNIRRLLNKLGAEDGEAFGYQVRGTAGATTVFLNASVRMLQCGYRCCSSDST